MSVKGLHSKPQAHKDAYTFRWVVGKTTGEGEQSSVEVIANAEELGLMVGVAYQLMDARMLIQNQRLQDFMEVSKDLPPEVQMKVRQCVDVAFGLATLKDLERVKQDKAERDEMKVAEESSQGELEEIANGTHGTSEEDHDD